MSDIPQIPLRIGYVLKRFPRLSETFILNELLQLERLGVQVDVFSLLRPPEEPRHALLEELKAPCHLSAFDFDNGHHQSS